MRIFKYEKQKFFSWIKVLSRLFKISKIDNFLIIQEFSIWKINILEIFIRDNLSLKDYYQKP